MKPSLIYLTAISLFWINASKSGELAKAPTDPSLLQALEGFGALQQALERPQSTSCDLHVELTASAYPTHLTLGAALLDRKRGAAYREALGEKCASFLSKLYQSGKSLQSSIVAKSATPIKSFPYTTGNHEPVFYHYTDSDALIAQMHPEIADRAQANRLSRQDGSYEKQFLFARSGRRQLLGAFFYLAEDPISSSNYGPHEISVRLSPDAKVIEDSEVNWAGVFEELGRRIPGLKEACSDQMRVRFAFYNANVNDAINYFVIEDSGVDLISYYSLLPFNGINVGKHSWFQLVSPASIVETRILK